MAGCQPALRSNITDPCARKPGFIHATVVLFDKTCAQATAGSTDDVLRLIAGGLSNKRIAQRLDITPETVKSDTRVFLPN